MVLVFVQRLTWGSLYALAVSGLRRPGFRLFYFDSEPAALSFCTLCARIGFIYATPERAAFHFGDLREESGETVFIRHAEDLTHISGRIRESTLVHDDFLRRCGSLFDRQKTLLFLEKVISAGISDLCVFVNAAACLRRSLQPKNGDQAYFFFAGCIGKKELCLYIRSLGLIPVIYPAAFFSAYSQLVRRLFTFAAASVHRFFGKKKAKPGSAHAAPEWIDTSGRTIVSFFSGRSLTLDRDKRSEFFWMLTAGIDREHVLLISDRGDIAFDAGGLDVLKGNGIAVGAVVPVKIPGSGILPCWRPKSVYRRLRRELFLRLCREFLTCLCLLRRPRIFFLVQMLYFADRYAYWSDFFEAVKVRISINSSDFTKPGIVMNAALENAGGVSLSYHWSNLCFSSIILSNCADIVFSFGPGYRRFFSANRSNLRYLVYAGYITDHAFSEVKTAAQSLRESLTAAGARFVITYFDENSSDERMCSYPTARAVDVYRSFLACVLANPDIAVIFKPGYPRTIHDRLEPIKDLIAEAKATRRCLFIDQGSYLSETLPTEAAQAADLAVGHLASGTVSLESFLSGIPTVFLDLEKLYSHPLYGKGRGRVVFDSLDSLFEAIVKYRRDPRSIAGFGDLGEWIKDKDPYRDGKASQRIGSYVAWLDHAFAQGMDREAAIEHANSCFRASWGKESVVRWH